jgi:hypothetical protein
MQLSSETMTVLKNMANINPNIVIKPGSTLTTIGESRTVFATATINEEFPMQIGIYDLNEFLAATSLVDQAELTFTDKYVTISDQSNRTSIKYFYSSPDILTTPKKPIKMPPAEVKFTVDNDTMNSVIKAAGVFGHDLFTVTANNGVLNLGVLDPEDSTSNAYSIDVDGEFESEDFMFVIRISNLKMLPGTYEVSLSSKQISQFKNVDTDICYWVALEKNSYYKS